MKIKIFFLILLSVNYLFSLLKLDVSTDREVLSSLKKGKDITLIGVQYKTPFIRWSFENEYNKYLFIRNFLWKKYGNEFLESMPSSLLNKVSIIQLDKKKIKEYKKIIKKVNIQHSAFPYKKIIFIDDPSSSDFLYEGIADFLNEYVDSYYYGLIYLQVDSIQKPSMVNKYVFKTQLSMSFIIYNRAGKKVYLKKITKKIEVRRSIANFNYEKAETYIGYYMDIFKENQKEINNAFKSFSILGLSDNKILMNDFKDQLKKTGKKE